MREDIVRAEASRYRTSWYDAHGHTNDWGIVHWMVRNVMFDIEEWAQGKDSNRSNSMNFTPDEAALLLSLLRPSAGIIMGRNG
jgi:hypothetical protein